MSLASRKLIQATAGAAGGPSDPDFANVVLLLDGDGTSGSQNETFTDSSTNGFTVTESGSVAQGSFSPYGDNWSNYFSGSDYLSTSDSADFNLGSDNWTIEGWFYRQGGGTRVSSCVFNQSVVGASSNSAFFFGAGSDGLSIYLSTSGSSWTDYIETGVAPPLNTWSHIAFERNGNNLAIYLNGTQQTVVTSGGSGASFSGTVYNSSRDVQIGSQNGSANIVGNISNWRVVKGTAVYTSNFTPSTSPLTAITNTKLLTCQSNRFIDNSSSSHTISVAAGTPKVTPFSPFKNDDARTLTTDGGSGYFNYGPYLTLPQNTAFNFGTGDFTVEFWANVDTYRTSGSYFDAFVTFGHYTSSPYFRIAHNGTLACGLISAEYNSTSTIDTGEWNHFAITRSGTTLRIFVNGTLETTATNSANLGNSAAVTIGTSSWQAANEEMKGYLSDVRIVKGTAVYTSSFTPSTSPLTAVTNTSALLNFQDAGIYDRSGINNLDTVGNAQIDTAVKKYGTGSMQFDGSGDYLEPIVAGSELALGTGDFTIEFWMNPASVSSTSVAVLSNRYDGSSDNVFQIGFDDGSSRGIHLHTQVTAGINTGVSATLNTWQHIAFVRSNGTLTCYKDGTSIGTPTTFTKDLSYTVPPLIGKDGVRSPAGTSANFNGYLDDLRITKGIARYTANFTPPDAALPKF